MAVTLKIDGADILIPKRASLAHKTNSSIALKTARINCIASPKKFLEFKQKMDSGNLILAALFVDDKLFIENYITNDLVFWHKTPSGTEIDITIFDRFVGIQVSDIIRSRPKGTLQSFLADILNETGYTAEFAIDSYQRKRSKATDFIVAAQGVDISKPLRAIQRTSLYEESSQDLLGECLTINKVMLISNGYDELRFEKPNLIANPIYELDNFGTYSNISTIEKYGKISDENSLPPSLVLTLNSYTKQRKSDHNTSVISPNIYGMPHIIKVSRVNMQASYQEIGDMMNFSFAGIKARSNSYRISICGTKFDNQGNFFEPNKTVEVIDKELGIDAKMIIMDVGLEIDSQQGSEITFNVCHLESFEDNITIKSRKKL